MDERTHGQGEAEELERDVDQRGRERELEAEKERRGESDRPEHQVHHDDEQASVSDDEILESDHVVWSLEGEHPSAGPLVAQAAREVHGDNVIRWPGGPLES
ncbi:MAG: hypothetical protein U0270_24465 [Labilithrix sp.]